MNSFVGTPRRPNTNTINIPTRVSACLCALADLCVCVVGLWYACASMSHDASDEYKLTLFTRARSRSRTSVYAGV